jgi:hypothetical protein
LLHKNTQIPPVNLKFSTETHTSIRPLQFLHTHQLSMRGECHQQIRFGCCGHLQFLNFCGIAKSCCFHLFRFLNLEREVYGFSSS